MLQVAPEQPLTYKSDHLSWAYSQRMLWLGIYTQINSLHVSLSFPYIGKGTATFEDPGRFPKEIHPVYY